MSIMVKNQKESLNTFKFNEKNTFDHEKNILIPLYAEHLHFLIKRTVWIVTKIRALYF